jgi:hypothetical protein
MLGDDQQHEPVVAVYNLMRPHVQAALIKAAANRN